jgi:hypothetical protein
MARKTTNLTAAQRGTESDKAETEGLVDAIRVRALNNRRCRLGQCFDTEGTVFAEDELTREQLEVFMADPLLKVEAAKIPAPAVDSENEGAA